MQKRLEKTEKDNKLQKTNKVPVSLHQKMSLRHCDCYDERLSNAYQMK